MVAIQTAYCVSVPVQKLQLIYMGMVYCIIKPMLEHVQRSRFPHYFFSIHVSFKMLLLLVVFTAFLQHCLVFYNILF